MWRIAARCQSLGAGEADKGDTDAVGASHSVSRVSHLVSPDILAVRRVSLPETSPGTGCALVLVQKNSLASSVMIGATQARIVLLQGTSACNNLRSLEPLQMALEGS